MFYMWLNDKHEMTHGELKRDMYIIPTSLFFPQAHSFLKTENTLKTVNRTHPSLLLTRFQFVSNSNFKQSCKTSWIKADNKSCWSRIQTVNLKSLCCVSAAVINNHALFIFLFFKNTSSCINLFNSFNVFSSNLDLQRCKKRMQTFSFC